ncbi:MAG: acyl--CoA ligase [Proteobacteria bacterium]|nr:acyl--CoA ligase [Pseudomonadota bacterium]
MIRVTPDLVKDYTARGWWGSTSLDEDFRANVARVPARLAMADPPNRAEFTQGQPRRLSYAEFDAEVDRLAAVMAGHGVGAGDVVAYQLPNIYEAVAILLACSRIGAVASPILIQFDQHELDDIFEQLHPRLFVSLTRFKDRAMADNAAPVCRAKNVPLLNIDQIDGSAPLPGTIEPTGPNDLLTVCWTSGTEGAAKGVMRTHNQWRVIGQMMHDGAGLCDGDVLRNARPMVNMAAIGGTFYSWLLCAGTMILHNPLDLALVLDQIRQERVTVTFMPPAFMVSLLKDPALGARADLSSLRVLGSGSAAIPQWAIDEMKDRFGVEIINFFGSNEGVSLLSNAVEIPDSSMRSQYFPRFGRPDILWASLPGAAWCETRLVDAATGEEITEPGVTGELRFKGPSLFAGYLGPDERTAEAFDEHGFYRTGDLFQIAGDGAVHRFYRFEGRSKEVIIRGGFNIAPAEIDNMLSAYPAIAEVAAFGYPDDRLGEKLGVAVVPKPGQSVSLDELVAYLREEHLAVFKLPQALLVMDSLPRNAMLKVLRWKLTELYVAQHADSRLQTAEHAHG